MVREVWHAPCNARAVLREQTIGVPIASATTRMVVGFPT